MPYGYPSQLKTIGDHIRAARLDRGLLQREAATQIGCDVGSVFNWEKKGTEPTLKHMPGIIGFLGYCPYLRPLSAEEQVRAWRWTRGLTRDGLANRLRVDSSSLWKLEAGHPMNARFQESLLARMNRLVEESD